jgi:hypothetical protein
MRRSVRISVQSKKALAPLLRFYSARRRARDGRARSTPEVFERCFRENGEKRRVFERKNTLRSSAIASRLRSPNQPPEPTSPAVTSRAGARLAPAGAVAHL